MKHTLPGGRRSHLTTVSVDAVPIMLTKTRVEVNLAELQPTLPLPDVSTDIKENDNREGQVGLEERLSITNRSVKVGDSSVELGNQNDDVEAQANVGAPNTKDSLEGNLVKRVAVILPGMSESNVAETDGAPGEQRSETGKSLKPGEDGASVSVDTEITQEAHQDDQGDGRKGTA